MNACRRRLLLSVLLSSLLALPAMAADCSVTASDLNFGEYDQINALDGTTTITVSCSRTKENGAENVSYTLGLSVGEGSYAARELRSGTSILYYNLYTDLSRTTVWEGGISPAVMSDQVRIGPFDQNASTSHTVYGRIPGNQSVEAGVYTSPTPITVTVDY